VYHIIWFCFLQCARQGFALGLTVLVDTVPSVKVDSVLKLIVDLLEVSSSMKGQVGEDWSFVFCCYLLCILFLKLLLCGTAGYKRLPFRSVICLWCSCPIKKTD
jgi:hypothetical protein